MSILLIYAFAFNIPYVIRFIILATGFVITELSYTYQIIRLHISLNKFAKEEQDKAFDDEIASVRVQAWGFYIGSILYLGFFVIEFLIVEADEMPFNLIVAGLCLEEFSYFIPTMYFWVCHYRVFS